MSKIKKNLQSSRKS